MLYPDEWVTAKCIPTCAIPLRRIFIICGVQRDGMCEMVSEDSEMPQGSQISFYDGYGKAFGTKESYQKCHLLLGDGEGEGEGCSEGLVEFPSCGVGLSG